MKHCPKCNKTKEYDAFSNSKQRPDGKQGWCKECCRARHAEYLRRPEVAARRAAYLAENADSRRKMYSAYREKHITRIREYDRLRNHDKERSKKRALRAREYKCANPKRAYAHSAVNEAIRTGKMTRGGCEVCGGRADAHHDDYNFPLQVRWLCRVHHMEWHKNNEAII